MSYLDTKFAYYPNNVYVTQPSGEISLRRFVKAVREPKPETKQLFLAIKAAAAKEDLELKGNLKKNLFYFTPCVNTDGKGRSYNNITSFTGFVQVDFDGIGDPEELRDSFFESVKSCTICGVSPSGKGIKAILRIPVVETVDEYKAYFYGIAHHLEKYEGFDMAPQNCCLPLYMFYDPDARYREDATVSTIRGEKINAFSKDKIVDIASYEDGEVATKEIKKKISSYIKNKINRIDDNAYPQILSLGTVIGGFVTYYSLDFDLVIDYTNEIIDTNGYMQKSPNAYKKGFKNFFFMIIVSLLNLL